MRDVLGPGTALGYGTNVHAGTTLEEVKDRLAHHACAVRDRVSPDRPMGIGLWLSAAAARALRGPGATAALAGWLEERGLDVFTLNGFPYGDFHRDVVKHDVYDPDWSRPERLAYTVDLLHVLAGLRPSGGEGSISTLPLGWGRRPGAGEIVPTAAAALRAVAREAAALEAATGTRLHVDLEPEPGCLLQRSDDVVRLFERHLRGGGDDDAVRRHLGVCHDVCHAAVMFEDQRAVFERYERAEVRIGKVQLSSAVRACFDGLPGPEARTLRDELAAFRERRYLHQTCIRGGAGDDVLHEDLPEALRVAGEATPAGEWRVHYHVPVFLERIGRLGTTREEIDVCLKLARARPSIRHFEVETYAWEVLPAALCEADLARGIAEELAWILGRARAGSAA